RVRPRRRARRLRRADAGADPHGADRHGREHPHPRLRGHHHRRHRVGPRRVRRLGVRRPGRHHRARLPARPAAHHAERERRRHPRAGALLDDDLHAHGSGAGGAARGPGGPAAGPVPRAEPMTATLTPRNAVVAALLALLALLPVYAALTGNTFALSLFTRIVIFAIAAVSLNLVMGFGGMVSFGHAVY